ncbi:MAG: hypothetical protein KAU47_01370 [Candidatus Aminicenantes bacterium]|nr:hypothetical protein [Candidatus Aminicenantes bacterium]
MWAADKFHSCLLDGCTITLIGGKKTSVPASFVEQFEAKYSKLSSRIKPLVLKGSAKPPSIVSSDEAKAMCVLTTTPKTPMGAVLMSHAMSAYGGIGVRGATICLAADPSLKVYVTSKVKGVLTNLNRTGYIISHYLSKVNKDDFSGKSIGTVLAIAGVICGLPLSTVKPIIGEKTINVQTLLKEVSDLASKL